MKRLEARLCEVLQNHMATGARPVVPLAGVPLWQIFAAISPGRAWTDAGPAPLTVAEIREQGQLAGYPLALRHIDVIRGLDRAWREAVAQGGKEKPIGELTAAAFDAMF